MTIYCHAKIATAMVALAWLKGVIFVGNHSALNVEGRNVKMIGMNVVQAA